MKNRKLTIAAIIAMVFGALSILAGGLALFGGTATEVAVGDAVPFVLWFNFGVHVVRGGAFEMRTVGAMILRALVWMAIVAIGLRAKLHSD